MSKETGSVWSTVFGNPRAGFFTVMLIVSILAFLGVTIFINTQANQDKEYISHAGELRVLSQELAKNAGEAASGKAEAFSLLRDARNNFQVRWGYLNQGNAETGLPPAKIATMTNVQGIWNKVSNNADQIVQAQNIILSLHEVAATLAETIPQLQVEYDEIVEILLDSGAPADQVAVAQRQSWLAERIVRSVNQDWR